MDLDDYLEYLEQEEEEEVANVRAPKRYIRNGRDPMEFYSEKQFKQRFQFSKDATVNYILPKIIQGLETVNNRRLPIAPLTQLLVTLRFYATASFQLVCGDLESVSQPSVSRIIKRVTLLLAMQLPNFIKFPLNEDARHQSRELFRRLSSKADRPNRPGWPGIPTVDGAVDCSHIRLTKTPGQEFPEVFRNRKGYFSLNVQAIVGPNMGPNMEFLNVVSRWAGSEHDSRIFQNSRVNMRFRQGELDGYLLGDGGYPSLPYLLTPFRNPANQAQRMYNNAHIKGRNILEIVFGVWKRRFPYLSKGLGTKLETSSSIVIACAVLHNMSIIVDNEMPEDEWAYVEEDPVPRAPLDFPPGEGFAVRADLVRRIFNV